MYSGLVRRLLAALLVLLPLAAQLTQAAPVGAALACADLVVSNITISPHTPIANQPANIAVTVLNQGTCAATGFVVQWKPGALSPTTLSGSVPGLGVGVSTTLNFTYAFPSAGNYLTVATANSNHAVPVSNPNDNIQIKSVTVAPATIDLSVASISFNPNPAVATHPMQASVRVQNSGNSDAGSFLVQWKPNAQAPTQTQQVNGVPAGSWVDVTFSYTYLAVGTYNTTVIVDPYNSVHETNKFNNVAMQKLTVEPPLPELAVQNVSINPGNPVVGQPAQLTATIVNQGYAPTGTPFEVTWKPWAFGPMLTQWVNTALGIGDSTKVSFNYTYPFSGSFTGTITADATNRVLEIKGSNTEQFQVGVGASTIDLTISSFTYTPPNPVQGQDVAFSVVIQNLGNTAAHNFAVSVNPDTTGLIVPSPATLTQVVTSLAGGASMTLTFHYQYPVVGNYRVLAMVDAFNTVAETNEANNQALQYLSVGSAVDLQVTGFSLATDLCMQATGFGNACSPMLYWRGSAITASIMVTNNGTFPAGSFAVEWLMHSTDQLGPTATVAGLLPGATTTVALSSTYQDAVSGSSLSITTVAVADPFNQIVETNKNNNTETRTFDLLPRNYTVTVTLTDLYVYNRVGDEWHVYFAALDPGSSCSILGQTIKDLQCTGDFGASSGDNYVNQALTVNLPDGYPLVVATGGYYLNITCVVVCFPTGGGSVGVAIGAYTAPFSLPSGTFIQGTQGDSSCSNGRCFDAYISATVDQGPPPPSQVGVAAPVLTSAQQSILNAFESAVQSPPNS